MQYLFLDTNIFIHFIDFEQIDWSSETQSSDKVIITIAPIVIDELDKHKYNKSNRISNRIKKLLPKIENSIENPDLLKYQIKIIDKRPSEETFRENHLDKTEQDDSLLAAIIEFKQYINDGDRIIYITNDFGPRLKAKSLSIDTSKPDAKYLLANEPDETQAKLNTLQKELNELKYKSPNVTLTFFDKSNFSIFKREELEYSRKTFIAKEIENVKNQTPFLIYTPPDKDLYKNPLLAFNTNPLLSLSEEQINNYNNELSEYLRKYEEYAGELFEAFNFMKNSIEIKFILENRGTAPAEDIDIEIHFPDGFELLSEEELPIIRRKPDPPYKPKNRMDHNFQFSALANSIPNLNTNFNLGSIKLNMPTIKKTNSYNVNYHLNALKHNQIYELEPLYAKFEDIATAKGFQIDYKLIISNIAMPIIGQLNINFED
jgi:hypothetical protein